MNAIVFTGPTLDPDTVRNYLNAEVRAPVGQGDVYRAAKDKPRAIGIIDGYFDGVPSVWHKEIIWAIEQGIAVFGSASMGALRAAELDAFGMIGVGKIFEDYLSGVLRDDDEVAVLHSPAELGYKLLSEPMVSIRATIAKACNDRVLTSEAAERIVAAAKAIHYRDRTWGKVLSAAGDDQNIQRLSEWLSNGRVDAKRDDACAMLSRMAVFLGDEHVTQTRSPRVERTLVWQRLVRRVDNEAPDKQANGQLVIDELRLNPLQYAAIRDRAALRLLALQNTAHNDETDDRDALLARMAKHRAQEGLARRDDILRWLAENDLDEADYEVLLRDANRVEDVISMRADRLEPHLLAELRWSGDYSVLKARADAKAQMMHETNASNQEFSVPEWLQMPIWYFEELLGRGVPEDLDVYANSVGLAGRKELMELIRTEFLYGRDRGGQPVGGGTE